MVANALQLGCALPVTDCYHSVTFFLAYLLITGMPALPSFLNYNDKHLQTQKALCQNYALLRGCVMLVTLALI